MDDKSPGGLNRRGYVVVQKETSGGSLGRAMQTAKQRGREAQLQTPSEEGIRESANEKEADEEEKKREAEKMTDGQAQESKIFRTEMNISAYRISHG